MNSVMINISKTITTYCADLEKNKNVQAGMNKQNLKIIQSFPYVKELLRENKKLKEELLRYKVTNESANLNLEIREMRKKNTVLKPFCPFKENQFHKIGDEDGDDEDDDEDEDDEDEDDEGGDDGGGDGEEDSDDDEVSLITINGSKYYTNDKKTGFLFKFLENGKVGAQIGYLRNGEPFFQNISEA